MTLALETYKAVMSTDCHSNSLAEYGEVNQLCIDNDWHAGTTTYIFEDGSKIDDCAGQLTCS